MVTRYEIAEVLKETWGIKKWKGEVETQGVYFNDTHAYVIEKTYALRIEHCESAQSVFFSPGQGDEEGEVYVTYPFNGMVKKPNKTNLLFSESSLSEDDIDNIFDRETTFERTLDAGPIIKLLERITRKRDRDRSVCLFELFDNSVKVILAQSANKLDDVVGSLSHGGDVPNGNGSLATFAINGNDLLHGLTLLSTCKPVHFSFYHDRMKFTSSCSTLNVEVVTSYLKL